MKTITYLSILIFAVIFTSCDETKRVIDAAGNIQLTGNYTVTQINGNKPQGAVVPTFSLSAVDNSFKGTTGCNSVFGNYNLDLYAIDFGDLAVSAKECAESDVMQNERNFLDALKSTGSYDMQNNVLTFYSKTDRSIVLKASKETNKN